MRWRWLLGDYASPDFGLTREQRQDVSRIAHGQYVAGPALTQFTFIVVVPPALLAFAILPVILTQLGMARQNVPYFVGCGMIVLLCWPWSAWAYSRIYSRAARMAMRDLGRDVCVECGYCLESLPAATTHCPECGSAREPMPAKNANEEPGGAEAR